ncbi:Bax inhibitor-1/YccA family protein [Streptomyces sp. AK02-04a]|uniref:Bax inhibitor-1/YccA family protein n=1 Tax=Streptomyces sp. AK02-04a TaxID=3028649 RepID=UPI0029B6601D|nr:Bax inhibitor-1/YccA family protein [Streptomyces sp. AK02-04a]MDX3763413.1 Bax inhibitor-1/YccA family protein [Streptomyces sp. AK02-04a]
MRSSNPVFRRRFPSSDGYAAFGTDAAAATTPYGFNGTYGGGNPYTITHRQQHQAPAAGRMTMDDVIAHTSVTLGTVAVGALLAWFALPVTAAGYGVAFGTGLVAMLLGLVQWFRRTASPTLIISYAAFKGVSLGVISHMSNEAWQGVPVQAVLGTMAVFAGMLLAYKTQLIRVTQHYYRIGMAIAFGFMLLLVVNLLFAAFGGDLVSGGPGILVGAVGVLLGAFFLSLDFKRIEDGVRYGAPRSESWLAAFGLTLSLVWLYVEMLRLITLLRGDD